jgi:hypothetical protein
MDRLVSLAFDTSRALFKAVNGTFTPQLCNANDLNPSVLGGLRREVEFWLLSIVFPRHSKSVTWGYRQIYLSGCAFLIASLVPTGSKEAMGIFTRGRKWDETTKSNIPLAQTPTKKDSDLVILFRSSGVIGFLQPSDGTIWDRSFSEINSGW